MASTGKASTKIYGMLLTPMFDDRRRNIHITNLIKLIDWSAEQNIDGLVVAPSIGEAPHMSKEEREMVFRVSIEHTKKYYPHLTMIAMTSECNTWSVIDFANYAKELGYHGQQVAPPFYWKVGETGLLRHYKLIWEETNLPIVLYHNLGLSKIEMGRKFIGKVAREIPLMGVKETETDPYTQLIKLFDAVDGYAPIYTTFRSFAWGLQLGAKGGFINTPTLPVCKKLAELFDNGKTEEMVELQKRITLVFPQKGERDEDAITLTKEMGTVVTGIDMGPVREPYQRASKEFLDDFGKEYAKLEEFMETL